MLGFFYNLLALLFLVSILGCATVTTAMWPPVEKEVLGEERIIDDKIGYHYEINSNERDFALKATPFCREKAPKYRVSKKQHRGIVFIIIETPIWGLGLADWVLSYAVSQGSEKKDLIEYVPTGMKRECMGKEISLKSEIVIQNSSTGELKYIITDENGNFSLASALGAYRGVKLYNLFVKIDGDSKYLTSTWW